MTARLLNLARTWRCGMRGHNILEYDGCRAIRTCSRCPASWVVIQDKP